MIVYAAFILGFIIYEIIKVTRFMNYKKAINATIATNRFSVCLLWVGALLYSILFVVPSSSVFVHIDRYIADPSLPLPFAFYALAPIFAVYKEILAEMLYAYNDEVLISLRNPSIPLDNLTIIKTSTNRFNRAKMVMKRKPKNERPNEKIILRKNTDNFHLLQSLINAENA
jgi:hypothetical protein